MFRQCDRETSVMDIRPIKNNEDYEWALAEIDKIFDAEPDSPESDRLNILVTLVEVYEDVHFDLPLPDAVAMLEYVMESRGLTRQDLQPYIGSRARVSEVLNRKRPLSLNMMRKLHVGLGISGDVLLQPVISTD